MTPTDPIRTRRDDAVRAQIDAVLSRPQGGHQVRGPASGQQRQRLDELLTDHGRSSGLAAPVHAVLAHPDESVLDELERLLGGDIASTERMVHPPLTIPPRTGLLYFRADEEPSAHELLRAAARDVPAALLAVQITPAVSGADLLQAGARAVFSDRVPLPDVTQALLTCLQDADRTVLLL